MNKTFKKELILEGLHCANCAIKIENQINKLEEVAHANVNFATKALTIDVISGSDVSDIIRKANDIIQKLEPDVVVKEKTLTTSSGKKTLVLNGLDCANCAGKIEKAVRNISGVKFASVDFVTKKLMIEVEHKRNLERVVAEASALATRIESGIEVLDPDQAEINQGSEDRIKIGKIIRLGIGAAVFVIALIFSFAFYLELGLFLISYILIGGEVVLRAVKNILRGQVFDENFLMCVATIGAFAIQQFPEAVAVMLFYQIGEFFQDLAVNHSRRSITALMDIRPDYANVKTSEGYEKVSPEKVAVGDFILIKPGEKVPLDGKIIEGVSMLDTSAITGESLPKEVDPGAEVLSGTVNLNGMITVEVTKVFGESTVSKILDLVQNASSKKAPTENFITKFARYYTPAVVVIALALALIPPFFIQGALFSDWIYRALVFLVISCPCALVISIPLGFFGGIGGASKKGILMKGSNYLEALNNVDTIVFDKTGTLTKGSFKVTKIFSAGSIASKDLLEMAAYAETYSTHPIAVSIIKEYGAIDSTLVDGYEEISGHGTKVNFKGKVVLAGNARLMRKEKIEFVEADELGTIVYVAVDAKYAGYIVISDEVKEDSIGAIQQLRELGIGKLVMLTGDSTAVGEKVALQLGLDEVYSELLPDQKVEKLEMLEAQRKTKGRLIFVGDGVNDAPVLTRADVGIAMGGLGSDAAIEAADVVIMTDEPSKIATAIKIARRTKNIVWQNIAFAFVVKAIVLVLGAGGLATMWEAVFADVGVALIAVFNAMRVLNVKNI